MILSIVRVAAAETYNLFNCNHPVAQTMVLHLDWVIHSSHTYLLNSITSLNRKLFYSLLFASSFIAQKLYLIFCLFLLHVLHLWVDVFNWSWLSVGYVPQFKLTMCSCCGVWNHFGFLQMRLELSILCICICGSLVKVWLVVLEPPLWHREWSIFMASIPKWPKFWV